MSYRRSVYHQKHIRNKCNNTDHYWLYISYSNGEVMLTARDFQITELPAAAPLTVR